MRRELLTVIMTSQTASVVWHASGGWKLFNWHVERHSLLSLHKAPSMFVGRSQVDTANIFVCTSRNLKLVTIIRFSYFYVTSTRDYLLPSLLLFIAALNPLSLQLISSAFSLRRCALPMATFVDRSVAEGHHWLSSVSNLSIDELPFRSNFILIATCEFVLSFHLFTFFTGRLIKTERQLSSVNV